MLEKRLLESQRIREQTILAIDKILYQKNKSVEQHCYRVSELCRKTGQVIGLSGQKILDLKNVGLLHDIGKIGIDEKILNKPGKLTEEEWVEIKRHPEIGYRILIKFNNMKEIADSVLAHQERWDGQGYPKGLKGKKIPLYARISAIADTFDAITHERSYRRALAKNEAIIELKKNAGTQFDPELIRIYLKNILIP